MRKLLIEYNSSGHIEILNRENVSDKRLVEVLKKLIKKLEASQRI